MSNYKNFKYVGTINNNKKKGNKNNYFKVKIEYPSTGLYAPKT